MVDESGSMRKGKYSTQNFVTKEVMPLYLVLLRLSVQVAMSWEIAGEAGPCELEPCARHD